MYTIRSIEWAAFMYLRSLSFNQSIAIMEALYQDGVISKDCLIEHIEQLADRIPNNKAITQWLKPTRSGYFAVDGTWMKYRGKDIVLLVIFDVKTLDIVTYRTALEEDSKSYSALIKDAYDELKPCAKGFFCDGELSLLKVLRKEFSSVPVQVCVFHKEIRAKQIIPFVRPRTKIDKLLKERIQRILFAPTKQEALDGLAELKAFAKQHQGEEKVKKIVGIIKRNFHLLLTHFDHPEMSPYNNVLEGFNHMIKRRIKLMKGFKKPINISRWLKLLMLDWRFHQLKETRFKERRNKTPLHLAGVQLPKKIYNWLYYVRKNYHK